MAGASVDCVGNLDLSSGEATAVFFTEHSTNTGNTALLTCGDQIEGLAVTPLGERFYGEPSDAAGNNGIPSGLSVYDYGLFPGNSPERGLMLITNGDHGAVKRGAGSQTGSLQAHDGIPVTLTLQAHSHNLRELSAPTELAPVAAKHNITLAIEGTLLKRARALAARRGLSVSALLADELRALVAEDAAYASAERVAAGLLQDGLPLDGTRITDRAALHDRHRVR